MLRRCTPKISTISYYMPFLTADQNKPIYKAGTSKIRHTRKYVRCVIIWIFQIKSTKDE